MTQDDDKTKRHQLMGPTEKGGDKETNSPTQVIINNIIIIINLFSGSAL
jgi:hypothetical protein